MKMARRKIVAGNWKMNKTPSEPKALVELLAPLVKNDDVDVVYCVPAVDIVPVVEAVKGSNVAVGAENISDKDSGAFTGEISGAMLKDAGVKYVIIGHSERRDYYKEDDAFLNRKVLKAFEYGLIPILCCGESLEQREANVTIDWIRLQLKSDLIGVTAEQAASMVIAYEPIWAIGTGKVATSEQANEVCHDIRECLKGIYDAETAENIRILYGGSVNKDCAQELFAMYETMPHEHITQSVASGNAIRRNPVLRHALSEVFGMQVLVPAEQEEAAFGAAMFAAVGAGYADNTVQLSVWVQYRK